jgi:hypothetical protein
LKGLYRDKLLRRENFIPEGERQVWAKLMTSLLLEQMCGESLEFFSARMILGPDLGAWPHRAEAGLPINRVVCGEKNEGGGLSEKNSRT